MNAGLSHFFRFVFLAASVVAACALASRSLRMPRLSRRRGWRLRLLRPRSSWSPTYCDTHGEGERGGRNRYYDRDRGHGGYGGYNRYRFYERRDDDDRDDDWRGYSRRWGDADEQCHSARPYAFVLHGLWPQYERRGWPENV